MMLLLRRFPAQYLACLAVLAGAPLSAQAGDAAALERGRELTRAFHAGRLDTLVAAFSPDLLAAVGGAAGLGQFREQAETQLGAETAVLTERVTRERGQVQYYRSARFERVGMPVATEWAWDEAGRVVGFRIRPEQGSQQPARSSHLEYRTKTRLRLPFDDEWTVIWGGRTVPMNYHAAYSDQRFAYDLVVVEDNLRYRSDGRSNEDYHCFGRPILAPGAGTVVEARDGVADNVPGEMNPMVPPGNHVVIDHGNGEYSFLAHLRKGSVRVQAGAAVARGDMLGLCGNSGNSSEPHLHYHMQTSPVFGQGEGLPTQFLDYVANGEPVARGEPVRGQRIRPAGEP